MHIADVLHALNNGDADFIFSAPPLSDALFQCLNAASRAKNPSLLPQLPTGKTDFLLEEVFVATDEAAEVDGRDELVHPDPVLDSFLGSERRPSGLSGRRRKCHEGSDLHDRVRPHSGLSQLSPAPPTSGQALAENSVGVAP